MKVQVCEISGMGGRETGGYEWGCQIACLRALRFMEQAKDQPQYHGFKNITGIIVGDNDAARQMDEFILAHPKLREYGMTGAMHQFAVSHAKKIHEVGREKYLELCRASGRGDEDFYEFEDSEAFPEQVPA